MPGWLLLGCHWARLAFDMVGYRLGCFFFFWFSFGPSWLVGFCQVGYGLGWLWDGLALSQVGFLLGWLSFGLGWPFARLALGWVSFELSWLWSWLALGFVPGWFCARLAFAGLPLGQIGFGHGWL